MTMSLIKCILGPRLYRMYRTPGGAESYNYDPNALESGAENVIKCLKICWSLCYWMSPVVLIVMYRRGFFTWDGVHWLAKFTGYVGAAVSLCVILRGFGRFYNKDYLTFLEVLNRAQANYNNDNKNMLRLYDCDFRAWPVDFRWNQSKSGDYRRKTFSMNSVDVSNNHGLISLPWNVLGYVAVHTFGRRMLYPGATSLIQTVMGPALTQGRAKLVEEKRGNRSKLLASDGNSIDTMFVDRRNNVNHTNGSTLVICCEGNSGFYEVGAMVTPLEAGYSVLGWNHPGFWGSSGVPWPSAEQNAIEAVVLYAIHHLGFQPHNIVMFAWSIGGYSASWAAMSFPDIKHIVLDATFDDVLPLAEAHMPQSWGGLVKFTIRKYLNLHNAELLKRYPGPVLLIRRTRDEMITTRGPEVLSSNRGNDLLISLLQFRYPNIVNEGTMPVLRTWVSKERPSQWAMLHEHNVEIDICNATISSYIAENSSSYPMMLGEGMNAEEKTQLALFLAWSYMDDYESTHCEPLPAAAFRQPWTV